MKGSAFDITLLSPAHPEEQQRWSTELAGVCDEFVGWQPPRKRERWQRVLDLLRDLPVNVAFDRTKAALAAVDRTLRQGRFDVVVFDFIHAAALCPAEPDAATVCFTHNVEAEIFARHAAKASRFDPMRPIWAQQRDKMARFEAASLRRFDRVVAVSERDASQFRTCYGVTATTAIPTGVDLDFFSWQLPPSGGDGYRPTVVFTGSMDWAANVDAVEFFLDEVWPKVLARWPDARFVVVGRHPPAALVNLARGTAGVEVTGFVDDVRPYGRVAHAFVIPLRVGGGTRIKAFEAMAMGCPVVSTAIGIEGLPVEPGKHFLLADSAEQLAADVLRLFDEPHLREGLSRAARDLVESRFGHRVAARVFEKACLRALDGRRSGGRQDAVGKNAA